MREPAPTKEWLSAIEALRQAGIMFYLIRQQYHSCPICNHILMQSFYETGIISFKRCGKLLAKEVRKCYSLLTESIVEKGRYETLQWFIELYTCTESEASDGGKGRDSSHEVTIHRAAL